MQSTPPEGEEDTDIWAVLSGYVSVTPLHLDLTAYESLEALRSLEGLRL
jgi:5'-nucleotidase